MPSTALPVGSCGRSSSWSPLTRRGQWRTTDAVPPRCSAENPARSPGRCFRNGPERSWSSRPRRWSRPRSWRQWPRTSEPPPYPVPPAASVRRCSEYSPRRSERGDSRYARSVNAQPAHPTGWALSDTRFQAWNRIRESSSGGGSARSKPARSGQGPGRRRIPAGLAGHGWPPPVGLHRRSAS